MGEVAARIADQIRGEMSGLEKEIGQLDAQLSQLTEERDRFAAMLEEARVLLDHHEKATA